MSRSNHHGCGRGCGVCGDAGAARRARKSHLAAVDAALEPDNIDSGVEQEPYLCTSATCCGCCGDRHMPPDPPPAERTPLATVGDVASDLARYIEFARAVHRALPTDERAEAVMARAMRLRSEGYTSRKLLPRGKP